MESGHNNGRFSLFQLTDLDKERKERRKLSNRKAAAKQRQKKLREWREKEEVSIQKHTSPDLYIWDHKTETYIGPLNKNVEIITKIL